MTIEDTNFILELHAVHVGGAPVDAIELADGRVLAIDGETVTLYDSLQALLDADNEGEEGERPAIAL